MGNIRDIRTKIANVGKTRKITNAMQQIAFAKLARSKKQAERIRPYARGIRTMMARMLAVSPRLSSPLMIRRLPVRRVGMIVVTTDKGLCGALNSRLLLQCMHRIDAWTQAGCEVSVTVIGTQGFAALRRAGVNVVAHVPTGKDLGDPESLLGTMSVPIMQYVEGQLDELYVANNRFVNTLRYAPVIARFLPFDGEMGGMPPELHCGVIPDPDAATVDYRYEPDAPAVVDALLMRYLEVMIYQAVAENAACEQSARMTAMKAATENCDRTVAELTVHYNKTRQEAITRELIEIVAGAAAVDER